MEIKVNVNIELGDRTFNLFKELFNLAGKKEGTPLAKAVSEPVSTPVEPIPEVKEVVEEKPVATPVPTAVPTAPVHTYTLQELGNAARPICDAGRGKEISTLLQKQFGVKSLGELSPDRYGEFATAIRAMGANI